MRASSDVRQSHPRRKNDPPGSRLASESGSEPLNQTVGSIRHPPKITREKDTRGHSPRGCPGLKSYTTDRGSLVHRDEEV